MVKLGDGFERLLEKWERFEQGHTKVRNDDMYDWFNKQGLCLLQGYCKNNAKLEYVISESGISVKIITTELLLMTDLDMALLKVLYLSSTCNIKTVEEKKLEISLWFRGWEWQEKAGCLSGTTEVE